MGKGTDVPTAKMKVQQDDISGQLVALAQQGKAVVGAPGSCQWLGRTAKVSAERG